LIVKLSGFTSKTIKPDAWWPLKEGALLGLTVLPLNSKVVISV